MRENEALRHRLSRLTEASLRINESLDFSAVLREVLDSARLLTGARYGVMTIHDDVGQAQDFLSSGMTSEESGHLWDTPGGLRLYEYLGNISQPLRLDDLLGYIRSVGLVEFHLPLALGSAVSFLASPMFHRGERIGNIYLGEKEHGEEFTQEDEETLVMFASQATMILSYARRYRDERQSRADLETLLDTSPVGMVVFDARTGAPVSFNHEAVRIVDDLWEENQSPEEVIEALTVRREDGRKVSLQEFPLAQFLNDEFAETVRAEEIVIQVPDGRSVTALMNATPIRSEEGEVVSFVVTLQDMTPLKDLERLRAEFLATVSHELRTPLTSIKGSVTTLLDTAVALGPAEILQFHRIIDSQADRMRELISDLLDVARIDTGSLSIFPEPTDVAVLVAEARNAFLSVESDKVLQVELSPDLPWVTADRLRIVQVLNNLLSNADRHSDEASTIRVAAAREGLHVAITVSDEGRGVSVERLPHLFRKFTRIEGDDRRRDIEGTGLGLSICKGIVEAHGGRIWAESDGPGKGARFTFTIPVSEEPESGASASPALRPVRSFRAVEEEQERVLVVDDDPQALRYVRDILSKSGYVPVATENPEEALRLAQDEKPHLALLDLVLPGVDGIDLMKEIRDVTDVPVIFLSAYDRDEIVARALDMGAADYVVKPFSPTELMARIRVALRDQLGSKSPEPFVLGELVIDYAGRSVTLGGSPVRLTAIEYRMLAELSANAGRVSTYDYLLQRVWGASSSGDLRPMRTALSGIRRKLKDDADNPTYIFTEPRIGYRMARGEVSG